MRIVIIFFMAFFFVACGAKLTLPKEASIDEGELKDLNRSYDWWKAYNDEDLNSFLEFVLANNTDINVARITLLSALANADLINYDLYPSLSGNLGISVGKNLNSEGQNRNFSTSFSLNYELDLYGKIRDSAKASEFSAKASMYDLQSLKLSIVNTALDYVFELAYFNDVEKLLQEYIANLEQMDELYKLKYELGKIEELDFLNTEQSLLQAKQNLLSNEQNRDLLLKNLQDLLGKEQGFVLIKHFQSASLSNFAFLKPNFDLPLNALSYRPDVLSKLNSLKASFKDYKAMQKSLLPSISLAGALSGQDKTFDGGFTLEFLNGNIVISLPFLDYARVRKNITISQFAYEKLLFEYEQNLQSAINEFVLNYKDYQSDILLLQNLENINAKQELIAKAYYEKYILGKSELKDYLDANNALNSSRQELLRAKFTLLKTINSYYQTTALGFAN